MLFASLGLGLVAGIVVVLLSPGSSESPSTLFSEGRTTPSPDAPLDLQFEDAEGKRHALSEFRGKVILLNLWATWCVPCREEMPTLDRLQAKLGGSEFQVLALSVDRGGPRTIQRFFAETGVANLGIYTVDMTMLRGEVGLFGLPTTLLVDREGREVERVVGPAEWDSAEKIALIRDKLGVVANLLAVSPYRPGVVVVPSMTTGE